MLDHDPDPRLSILRDSTPPEGPGARLELLALVSIVFFALAMLVAFGERGPERLERLEADPAGEVSP